MCNAMNVVTDQIGEQIYISKPIKRIVSLVPSLTETLVALGLQDTLVGITKFCIHPIHLKNRIAIIGGTKQIHIDNIKALAPDIVIASKEENIKTQIDALKTFTQVYVSDIKDINSLTICMKDFDVLFEKPCSMENWFVNIVAQCKSQKYHKATPCIYLIWKNPYITIGGDTFINYMLNQAGFINVFEKQLRYPQLNIDDIKHSSAEYILLSSEPFPFKEKHIAELQQICGNKKIILVDGEIFSWYRYRMVHAIPYFATLHKMLKL
jgi:iron complex transport system substrate-binding protein